MRHLCRLSILVAVCIVWVKPGAAAEPLVDATWVRSNIGKPGLVFLDVRSFGAYRAAHVPGAIYTNYGRDGWRVKKKGVPGMLPDMQHLEKLIGGLGIGNDSHVVILSGGYSSGEMGVATRIYWTFKVVGLETVSILNGGMESYLDAQKPHLEKGAPRPIRATFTAKFQPQYLATAKDVKTALAGNGQLIDHRPNDQFVGVNKSGQVKRHGTLPGAVNLPGKWTTVDDGGVFRDAETLKTLFEAVGASTEGGTIAFCNTGHWASLGWFVQHEILGNKAVRMYDGSLADWTVNPGNPVDRKIPIR
jgi:thiosulfate/3-mercaptopyruvate sulfurtransferase